MRKNATVRAASTGCSPKSFTVVCSAIMKPITPTDRCSLGWRIAVPFAHYIDLHNNDLTPKTAEHVYGIVNPVTKPVST